MEPLTVETRNVLLADVQAAMPGHYATKTDWPDDVDWPEFTMTIRHWGVVEHDDVAAMRGMSYSANPFQQQQTRSSLETGRTESLCQIVDIWQEHRPEGPWYRGGEHKPESWYWHAGADGAGYNGKAEQGYDDMVRWGLAHVGMRPFFWLDKIMWCRDGDRRRGRVFSGRRVDDRVARIGGTHYVLGSDVTGQAPRSGAQHRGMGGRRLAFLFHDGTFVESDDVWYQGVIPIEFRHLLPDNAVMGDAARQDPAEVASRIPS